MPMKNPPHVGETIWHDIIKPLDLSVTEGARRSASRASRCRC